ncbi:MAG: MFS transporter [Methanobacteriaceae archaeon]|nr:MFS transporter [Methanobacteriaceae archaeon]
MEKLDNNSIKLSAMIIAAITSFITPFMGSSINIALPAISIEFSTDAILLSWVATSYILAAAMFSVPFGRIADIYGMKKVFTYGIIIFTISSLLSAIAPSALTLIIFRIMQGIGSAMVFVTGLAIITHVFPPQERGKAIGINIASVYIGLSLGPVLGGFMTQFLGWRSIFILMILLGMLVILLTYWKLKMEWTSCKGEKFDFPGSILYSFALLLIIYGFSLLPGIYGIILLISGIIGILGFVKWELKAESPVMDMKLFFKNTTFAFSNLAALINYSATFAVTFLLSLYLQYLKGFSPQSAGLILVSQPIMMAIMAPLAGRLSDKYNPRVIASVGMSIVTAGLLVFTFINDQTSINLIIGGLVLLGFGFGLFSSPNTNAIMGSVERRYFGVASASVSTMRLIGQAMSMGIVMLIFSLFIGNVQIIPQNYPELLESIKLAFIIFTTMCFVGIFASIKKR